MLLSDLGFRSYNYKTSNFSTLIPSIFLSEEGKHFIVDLASAEFTVQSFLLLQNPVSSSKRMWIRAVICFKQILKAKATLVGKKCFIAVFSGHLQK